MLRFFEKIETRRWLESTRSCSYNLFVPLCRKKNPHKRQIVLAKLICSKFYKYLPKHIFIRHAFIKYYGGHLFFTNPEKLYLIHVATRTPRKLFTLFTRLSFVNFYINLHTFFKLRYIFPASYTRVCRQIY